MTNAVILQYFDNLDQVTVALCDEVPQLITRALQERGRAHLMLSGGNTPKTYLPKLAASRSDWVGVQVSLTDERFVPVEHDDSNEGMIHKQFILRALGCHMIGMAGQGMVPNEDALAASIRYQDLIWPVDVSLLGVGEDGHIASLFPGQSYANGSQIVISTKDRCRNDRLSLSPERLLSSRNIFLIAHGRKKRDTIEKCLQNGPACALPVGMVIHQKSVTVKILMC